MKIKFKDAMKLAEKIAEIDRKIDNAFRCIDDDRRYTSERICELEKRIASLEMKLAEMNGEVNKPGCDNACACETKVAYF